MRADAGYAELPGASAQLEMWGTFEGRVVFVRVGSAELVIAGKRVADEAPIGDHPVVRVAAEGAGGGTDAASARSLAEKLVGAGLCSASG